MDFQNEKDTFAFTLASLVFALAFNFTHFFLENNFCMILSLMWW